MKQIDTFYMSEKQIEMMKRKRKLNKKVAFSATLVLTAIASSFALGPGNILQHLLNSGMSQFAVDTVNVILKGIHIFGSIIGVCSFAKALHDPLDKKEAEELAEKDSLEKRGYSK